MLFETSLIKGTLIKRYKRFLCDVKLENNNIITAHCPNSGSMLSLNNPPSTVYLSKTNNPKAKLNFRLELVESNNFLVGINTLKANQIVLEALQNKKLPELVHFSNIKKEATFKSNCRFDFMLYNNLLNNKEICYLEVKSVTLCRNKSCAEFPDAVTARGQKHLQNLIEAKKLGYNAYLLFLIQREDCNNFSIAHDIDKEYYLQLKQAILNGVKVLCYNCKVSTTEVTLHKSISVNF